MERLSTNNTYSGGCLSELFEQEIIGYAYPYGHYNDMAVNVLRECGIKYARTVEITKDFGSSEDLLRFKGSFHHNSEGIMEGVHRFLEIESDEHQLLYIWGHSYEFEAYHNCEHMEDILKLVSGREDIFYGTNAEVLL